MSHMMSDVCVLLGAERARRQELEEGELLEQMKIDKLKPAPANQPAAYSTEGYRKHSLHGLTLDYLKKKSKEVTVI